MRTVYRLGNMENKSDEFWQMEPSRSTGYFGTGFYFCKNPKKLNTLISKEGRKLYRFTVDETKMLYGTMKKHEQLKSMNRALWNNKENYKEEWKINFGNNIFNILDNIRKQFPYDKDGELEINKLNKNIKYGDSFPTMILKKLGYIGVFPSEEMDNTSYGGVIFDKPSNFKINQNYFSY